MRPGLEGSDSTQSLNQPGFLQSHGPMLYSN